MDASQKGEGCDRRLATCRGHMAYVLVHIAVYKRRALNVPYKIIFYIQLVNVMRACLTGGGMVNVRHQGGANELSRCALPANWRRRHRISWTGARRTSVQSRPGGSRLRNHRLGRLAR
ncbi:hypothetical protein HMPREF3197_00583 [Klebsiella pneumoniae]|nr:hypothetical protein HMPREF3197_00583 [Klebsiella pneumoniae]